MKSYFLQLNNSLIYSHKFQQRSSLNAKLASPMKTALTSVIRVIYQMTALCFTDLTNQEALLIIISVI